MCANEKFMCGEVPNVVDFASYRLLNLDKNLLVKGHKRGFCLVSNCTSFPEDPDPIYCATLYAGCMDYQPPGVECQYIDITNLKSGNYKLEAELNEDRSIAESSFDDNVDEYDVKVCDKKINEGKMIFGEPVSLGTPFLYANARNFNIQASFDSKENLNILKSLDSPIENQLVLKLFTKNPEIGNSFNVLLPTTIRGQGCSIKDGWKRKARNHWIYKNESGYLDRECTINSEVWYEELSIYKNNDRIYVDAKGAVLANFVGVFDKSNLTIANLIPGSSDNRTVVVGCNMVRTKCKRNSKTGNIICR
jgi:hypothetical protein